MSLVSISLTTRVSAVPSGASFDHIVILAMENQNYVDVLGDGTSAGCPSATAPFLCSMLPYSSTIPNYHSYCGGTDPACASGISGCSAACYTAVTSGNTYSVSDGLGQGSVSQTSIFDSLASAGLTWTEFCESGCPRGPDHSPCLQYASTNNSPNCIVMSAPLIGDSQVLSTFDSASPPNYIWITPTDSHNMHDNSIASGDAWAQSFLVGTGSITSPASGSLLATGLFTNPSFRTLLYIWWDEYDPSPNIIMGSGALRSFASQSNSYDEYASLHTIENNWGLPTLSHDAQAPLMSDIFSSNKAGMSVSFTYSPATPNTGTTVAFTGLATGGTNPYTYAWSFGDGSKSSGASASHSYASTGQYTVTLNATDSTGKTAKSSQILSVTSPRAPSVSFSYSPSAPITGTVVSFAATPTGGTSPYAYSWNFGDGGLSTGAGPGHTFNTAGTYGVTVTVTDGNSLTGSSSQQVTVTSPQPPQQLSASFSYSPASPTAGTSTSFSPSVTGGTTPYSYSWTLGDGTSSAATSPSYAYANAGTYTVSLSVTDSLGQSAIASQIIQVSAPLAASLSYTPTLPIQGATITFTANPTGGAAPYSYSWDFGDGITAVGSRPGHMYAKAGNYTVTVSITDSYGNTATQTQQVAVRPTSPPGQPPTPSPSGHPSGGGICVTCGLTQLFTTLSPLVIGLLAGTVLGASMFLARYHGQNRRLARTLAQKRLEAQLARRPRPTMHLQRRYLED